MSGWDSNLMLPQAYIRPLRDFWTKKNATRLFILKEFTRIRMKAFGKCTQYYSFICLQNVRSKGICFKCFPNWSNKFWAALRGVFVRTKRKHFVRNIMEMLKFIIMELRALFHVPICHCSMRLLLFVSNINLVYMYLASYAIYRSTILIIRLFIRCSHKRGVYTYGGAPI